MKQLTDSAINSFSGRTHPQGAGSVLHKMVQDAVRLLGLLIAFGVFGAQAQADAQNSITALSISTGNGTTVIKVELA